MPSRDVLLWTLAAAAAAGAVVTFFVSRPEPKAPGPVRDVTVCLDPANPCSAAQQKARPRVIEVTGDGSGYVKGISWEGWGEATATGTGTFEGNNCVPSCAAGTFTGYPATLILSGLSRYGVGKAAYSRLAVAAPRAGFSRTFSSGLVP